VRGWAGYGRLVSVLLSRIFTAVLVTGLIWLPSLAVAQDGTDPVATPEPGASPTPGEEDPSASPSPSPSGEVRYWKASLPGGDFVAVHSQISGFGLQDYLVDGTIPVTELTVALQGSGVARFYYIEDGVAQLSEGPAGAAADVIEEKIRQAGDRVGAPDLGRQPVVKAYPVATHAHTIEYRLPTRDSLQRLFLSLEESLTKGETRVYRQ